MWINQVWLERLSHTGVFIRMCYGVTGWVGIEFKELLSIALRIRDETAESLPQVIYQW